MGGVGWAMLCCILSFSQVSRYVRKLLLCAICSICCHSLCCCSLFRGRVHIQKPYYDNKSYTTMTLHLMVLVPLLQTNTTRSLKQSCSRDDGHNDARNMLRIF